MPALELISGALALGNLFSDLSANSQQRDALKKYQKKLIDLQYDPVEKAKAIDKVGDLYNTNMADAMNSSAFGLGRFSNANTAKAVSMSKMLGQRSGAIVEESRRIDDFNKNIDMKIAESELSMPQTDVLGSLIEGGATGLQLGMSIGNYEAEQDWSKTLTEKLKGLERFSGGVNFDVIAPISKPGKYKLGKY